MLTAQPIPQASSAAPKESRLGISFPHIAQLHANPGGHLFCPVLPGAAIPMHPGPRSDPDRFQVGARHRNQRPNLLPDLVSTDLTKIRNLEIPLILFEGRHDLNVNSELAAAWFEKVKAPEKHLVWFEHSGHIPMTEEPGKCLFSRVHYARPIRERAGDSTPATIGTAATDWRGTLQGTFENRIGQLKDRRA